MANINKNFLNLKESYLFYEIANRISEHSRSNPDVKVIKLGIGDVTLPLPSVIITELNKAVQDMADVTTFKGYGPEIGHSFLREEIRKEYQNKGIQFDIDEIFISDGINSDIANITDLFSSDNIVLIPDPVYPVYNDSNVMNGRTIKYMDSNESNGFLPIPTNEHADMIYLCSPNNPTGSAYTKEQLRKWVDYALDNNAVILCDSAYSSYISDDSLPHSIFEIEGAKKCAIEFCSFSKSAGFTGLRCGYTIVPKELVIDNVSLNKLWLRRQTTKFNGASYIIQKGAVATFTEEGKKATKEMIDYYMRNAKLITDLLKEKNIYHVGGVNAPYIWLKCPHNMDSWKFFDYLLKEAHVAGTPGSGFGKNGEGYFRLTAFGNSDSVKEAVERLRKVL